MTFFIGNTLLDRKFNDSFIFSSSFIIFSYFLISLSSLSLFFFHSFQFLSFFFHSPFSFLYQKESTLARRRMEHEKERKKSRGCPFSRLFSISISKDWKGTVPARPKPISNRKDWPAFGRLCFTLCFDASEDFIQERCNGTDEGQDILAADRLVPFLMKKDSLT